MVTQPERHSESQAKPAFPPQHPTQPTYPTGLSTRWSLLLLLTIALVGAAVLYLVIKPS
jgi:hypothetical protein